MKLFTKKYKTEEQQVFVDDMYDALANVEINDMLPTFISSEMIMERSEFGTPRSFMWAIMGLWKEFHPEDFDDTYFSDGKTSESP